MIAAELADFIYDNDMIISVTSSARERAIRYHKFITQCCERFPHVIYVAGNHESYHGDFAKTYSSLRDSFKDLKNLHILDKEYVIIDDVLFFGGTLWTDMNREDPITMFQVRDMLNDYQYVKNSNTMVSYRIELPDPDNPGKTITKFKERVGSLTTADTVKDHNLFKQRLDEVMEEHPELPVVVVGHHAPSKQSTHPRYAGEYIMNGAYSSDMDEWIMDRPRIKLWTHGHTHEPFDYAVGVTRVVCNPRGYTRYEAIADNFNLKYVEV